MSENFPECPLPNHNICKRFYDPKICAIARKEDVCLWKQPESKKELTDDKNAAELTNDKKTESEDIVQPEDEDSVNRLNEKTEKNERNSRFWIFGQAKKRR